MEPLSLREFAIPMIKAIDSFNYLLKSHHRRVAIISYHIGKELGLGDSELFELVVAASLHDIGALSVQEKNMLLEEDVKTPLPHCIMGYKMLETFEPFKDIATIIRYHHVDFLESHDNADIPLHSYIIHLADRVDILISPNEYILNQTERVVTQIKKKSGGQLHPLIFEAFERCAKSNIFWLNINAWSVELLFSMFEEHTDYRLSLDTLTEFACVFSKIIDYRSYFTRSHSYTVAHLASLLGELFDFSEEKCQKLMIAGYLHDIRKLDIEPNVSDKEDIVSDVESSIMHPHVYYAGLMLDEMSFAEWFSNIVIWAEKYHQQKVSAYLHAEDREALDTGVKVLAFADMIATLMESEPDREGMSLQEAFEVIRTQIADSLSSEMFAQIEEHADEIDTLVLECQQHALDEYNSVLELVVSSSY